MALGARLSEEPYSTSDRRLLASVASQAGIAMRSITLAEKMAERMEAQPEKFKLRKTLAEHPFGTIKRWMGYTHFTLKGLEKVRTEWSLITLAYNFKRVLNLLSVPQLIAAVS